MEISGLGNISYDVDTLIGLLGLERSDVRIVGFINQFNSAPIFTVDEEDGANDEYIEFKSFGFGLYFENEALISVFLHSGEKDPSYSRYQLPLPMKILFEQTKYQLLDSHGVPNEQGGGRKGFFGVIPEWVKYRINNYTIHIEFNSSTGRIDMVTIGLR